MGLEASLSIYARPMYGIIPCIWCRNNQLLASILKFSVSYVAVLHHVMDIPLSGHVSPPVVFSLVVAV